MVTEVIARIQQRLWETGQSVAGDGMLLRLRNASIALVGAVAAVGLGLTLFISQLGFPGVFSGPIPANPAKAGSVHDAIALTRSQGITPSSPLRSAGSVTPAHVHSRRAVQRGGDTGIGGSHQLAVSPNAQSGPAAPQPASPVRASEPTIPSTGPSASTPSPTPTPAAVESQPTASPGGQSKGTSDAKSPSKVPAVVKATSDGNGKSGSSGKSKGHQTSKADGQTTSVAKSTDSPAEKAGNDQGAATTPNSATSASAPAAKETPEATSPAAAKEAADSGGSDRPRH
jgi:hypothetical protein